MFDINRYLKVDSKTDTIVVTAPVLTFSVNTRWAAHGGLSLDGSRIRAIAIGDFECGEDRGSWICAGITYFYPSAYTTENDGKHEYLRMTFRKGDTFMDAKVSKDQKLGYAVFYEMLYLGVVPKHLNYANIFDLFDKVAVAAGLGEIADHAIWELIYATVFCDAGDMSIPLRLSKGKGRQIPLRDATHLATSTSAKLTGSFFNDGITSALAHPAKDSNTLENLLRR